MDIFKDLEYLYAENIGGDGMTVQIVSISDGAKFVGMDGRTTSGFAVTLDKMDTDKKLGMTGTTVKRQIALATGTTDTDKMVGKWIHLFTIDSRKSVTGRAIRLRAPTEDEIKSAIEKRAKSAGLPSVAGKAGGK